MKRYAILLLLIGLTATFANAQFPIKIPKIKIPKVGKPKTQSPTPSNQPQRSNVATRTAQQNRSSANGDNPAIGMAQNRQMVMNDAFTLFVAEDFKRYEQNKIPGFSGGWYLISHLEILGTFPDKSAFRVVLKKNGKELSNVKCEGRVYRKADDSKYKTPAARAGKVDMNFEDSMTLVNGCTDKTSAIKQTGKMNVEVFFIDGDTNSEKLVRKYVVDVHESTRVKGRKEKPVADYSDYYIQRHAETAVAYAYLKKLNSSGKENAQLRFETSFSTDDDTTAFVNVVRDATVQCSANGQKLSFDWDKVRTDSIGYHESAIYIDRKTAKYRAQATPYRETIKFKRITFDLPVYTGDIDLFPGRPKLEDHPGKWECTIISKGVTLRTFRWEVGTDGRIVAHGEQKNGNINLHYNAFLVDMEIPAGGSPFDIRLVPMPEMGLFYGIPWTTAEGKTMAARIPRKGSPSPVPSTQAK